MQSVCPEAGYGYIQNAVLIDSGSDLGSDYPIHQLKAFKEKLNIGTTEAYLGEGGFTWNSSFFLWSARIILCELCQHVQSIMDVVDQMIPSFLSQMNKK